MDYTIKAAVQITSDCIDNEGPMEVAKGLKDGGEGKKI